MTQIALTGHVWSYSPIYLPTYVLRPFKVGLDLEQIAIEGFLALTCLLGPSDEHIKSLQLLDTGKVVNLHKFKMAAIQSFNLQITFLWLLLDPINVLQTTFFGF